MESKKKTYFDNWKNIDFNPFVILIIITLIIFAWMFITFQSKDNYKITINECHDEEISMKQAGIKAIYYNKSSIINITFQKEVCEDKEVDNLSINCKTQDYNIKDYPSKCIDYINYLSNCNFWASHYIKTFKDDPDKYECKCKIPTINKKDINKEWLKEQLISGLCVCIWDCSQISKCPICYEYHCGENYKYKIEVK